MLTKICPNDISFSMIHCLLQLTQLKRQLSESKCIRKSRWTSYKRPSNVCDTLCQKMLNTSHALGMPVKINLNCFWIISGCWKMPVVPILKWNAGGWLNESERANECARTIYIQSYCNYECDSNRWIVAYLYNQKKCSISPIKSWMVKRMWFVQQILCFG